MSRSTSPRPAGSIFKRMGNSRPKAQRLPACTEPKTAWSDAETSGRVRPSVAILARSISTAYVGTCCGPAHAPVRPGSRDILATILLGQLT